MEIKSRIVDEVSQVYEWIDAQIKANIPTDERCQGCGNCCDFEKFGHKLYLTSPELVHFRIKMGKENLRAMHSEICPYRVDGKCEAHENRFAGCRIFFCKADEDFQSQLSESVIVQFKEICKRSSLPYQYKELSNSLNFICPKHK